jgi:predicted nucleotidyltransferase
MNPIESALRAISSDLADQGRSWALIGGLAVSARAEPRTTRDVDVVVAVSGDADAEAVVFALQNRGYRLLLALEQSAVGRLSTVRLSTPGASSRGVVVDVLFASSGIEPEIIALADAIEIVPGLTVPIARTGHLIALKLLARDDRRRPQDWDDIQSLLSEADATDVAEARAAVELVVERGYHRGKGLVDELNEILRDHPRPR